MADVFWEGFDKYGAAGEIADSSGNVQSSGTNLLAYWASIANTVAFVAGRFTGQAVQISVLGTLSKTLPANYATLIFGFAFQSNLSATGPSGMTLTDSGTAQISVIINSAGQIEIHRGGVFGTLLATSTQTVTANTWHYLEGQITLNSSSGAWTIDLDGVVTSLVATAQNTVSTANNSANGLTFNSSGTSSSFTVDDMYVFDNTGAVNNAMRGDSRVETLLPVSDSAVTFAFGAAVLGAAYSGTGLYNAPGANELALRKYTMGPAGTLASIGILPSVSSGTANFKGVVYADNGSGTAPSGAPIATGTQVTGCTAGAALALPFASPPTLSASTIYWIGFITDTSVALFESDANTLGFSASNTYTSGAPTTPSMTGSQPSWTMWGNLTGVAVNWYEEGQVPPLGDLSYVSSSTVGNEDLFNTAGLSSTPTSIAGVKVSALVKKTDAGARTLNLQLKSSSTDSAGSNAGQAPATSYTYLESYYDTDPATGSAWVAADVSAAKIGYKIAS